MNQEEQARILVIDDDDNVRNSLAAALRENGYLVDVAETGKDAIAKSMAILYNLALVDLRLPDMNGLELLTQMREKIPKMVKIIVTGYPSLENAIEAVNRGANGYIVKPYTMEDLLQKVKEQLQRQRESIKYSEERVREFIEARAEEHDARTSAKGARKR